MADEKLSKPRTPDEAQFQKGHTYQCKKCGYTVKTYDEWVNISKVVRCKHLLYDEHDEEIHICPKCGEYVLNWNIINGL